MTTTALKKKIATALEKIEDKKLLEAIHTIVINSANESQYIFSEEDDQILEERRAKYLSGKAKTISLAEIRKKVEKKLSKK